MIHEIDQALPEIRRFVGTASKLPPSRRPLQPIRSVWKAVDETRRHLAKLREREIPHPTPNRQLVELWCEAALAITKVDPELGMRLREKAEYWSDPADWLPEQIAAAGIELDRIAAESRELLRFSVASKKTSNPVVECSYDVFISHASEDKADVARPIADELVSRGVSVWYDQFTLRLGDSLLAEIDRGLRSTRFGVVILSPAFFSKHWPQAELGALVSLESADGQKRILPVWHNVTRAEVAQFSPILSGRLAASTDRGIVHVVDEIIQVLRPGEMDLKVEPLVLREEHRNVRDPVGPVPAGTLTPGESDLANQLQSAIDSTLRQGQNPSGRESILLKADRIIPAHVLEHVRREYLRVGWRYVAITQHTMGTYIAELHR
ncbi:MAG TPA: toll/interleukin-1 receptor domain-containing protein [Longimicrobium sp.]|nr:toll/interleukin-1 receptor domain-containing protein [Longimicrobium sp.]